MCIILWQIDRGYDRINSWADRPVTPSTVTRFEQKMSKSMRIKCLSEVLDILRPYSTRGQVIRKFYKINFRDAVPPLLEQWKIAFGSEFTYERYMETYVKLTKNEHTKHEYWCWDYGKELPCSIDCSYIHLVRDILHEYFERSESVHKSMFVDDE